MTAALTGADLATGSREDDLRDAPVRRIAALFRPERGWVALLLAVSVLQGASGVVSPFLLRDIIDTALPERDGTLVSLLAGGMILAALVTAALGVTATWLANLVGQRVMHALRVRVFSHLQQMSLGFYTRTQSGELQSRLANDVGGVDGVVTNTANTVVANVIAALAVGVAALVMDWQLAAITLVVVPVFLLSSMRLARTRRRLARGRQRRLAGITAQIEQALSVSGILLTKTMGRERDVVGQFAVSSRELSRVEMDTALSGRWQGATRRAALTMIPAIVYWVAGLAVANGASFSSIGTVVAFTSMLNRLVAPATALQGIGVTVATSRALFGRIFEVLDLPTDVPERPDARALPAVRGDVRIDNVSFRYADEGPWTLHEIDFEVPAGTTTAIVGRTGSGKTTLAYLIARLYDPDRGAVRIDDVDVRDLQRSSLTDAVGLVPQETFLRHDTVGANLRFARPGATDEQLHAAARAAHIHDVVAALPDGYDTVVGARGHRFSGGERQRLAIARMILRDPAILVLDEATSALDNETERLVQIALNELTRGRTTIAIAHRLSTVRTADQILVVEGGRIIERGRHEELLAADGHYAVLARTPDLTGSPSGSGRDPERPPSTQRR
jgi:ATP-binding cassette subfamily B protein